MGCLCSRPTPALKMYFKNSSLLSVLISIQFLLLTLPCKSISYFNSFFLFYFFIFNFHWFVWVANSAWKPQSPPRIVPIEFSYKCFLDVVVYFVSTDFVSAKTPVLAQQLRSLLWSGFQWNVLTPWPSWHLLWEQMEKTVHNMPVGLKAENLVVPWVACLLTSIAQDAVFD